MGWKEDLEERRKRAEEARKKAGRSRATKSSKSFADIMENIQKTVTEGLTKQTAANKKKKADADKKYGVTVTKTTVKTTDPFEGLDMSKKVDMPVPKSKPKKKADSAPKSGNTFKEAFAAARKAGNKEFTWNGKKYAAVTADEVKKAGSKTLGEYLTKKKKEPVKASKGAYISKARTGGHDFRSAGTTLSVQDRRRKK